MKTENYHKATPLIKRAALYTQMLSRISLGNDWYRIKFCSPEMKTMAENPDLFINDDKIKQAFKEYFERELKKTESEIEKL